MRNEFFGMTWTAFQRDPISRATGADGLLEQPPRDPLGSPATSLMRFIIFGAPAPAFEPHVARLGSSP
jgi:hypothetical protein